MDCIQQCLRHLLNYLELDNTKLCSICLENEKNTAFFRCGHKCVCADCASRIMKLEGYLKKCPICRKDIVGKLRIYD